METAELGITAAELMERLEREYAGKDDVKLGVVAVIAEVGYTDREGDEVTAVEYRCSDGRHWIQSGLFAAASRACHSSFIPIDDDDD